MPACSLLILAACGRKQDSTPAANAGRTEYVVAIDGDDASFTSENEQNQLVDIKIKIINTPFDGLFNALTQGDCDILIFTITICQQHWENMDFSDPYFVAK